MLTTIQKVDGYDVLGAEWDGWMIFDGEPSCNDVTSEYRSFSDFADVSQVSGVRCKGCGNDPDITELEINSGTDWGHYTIYSTYLHCVYICWLLLISRSLRG
jgi:hypothetical protein